MEYREKKGIEREFYNESGILIDFYSILGVNPSASYEEIEKSYQAAKDKGTIDSIILDLAYNVLSTNRMEYAKAFNKALTSKAGMVKYVSSNNSSSKSEITIDDIFVDETHSQLKDFYRDLGVSKNATVEEIENAYQIAKFKNTIKFADSKEVKQEKESDLAAATLAYRVLIEKREEYDRLWDNMFKPLKPSIEELANFNKPVTEKDFYFYGGIFRDFYDEIGLPNTESTENILNVIKGEFNSVTIESNDTEQEKVNKNSYLRYLAYLYKVFTQYRDLYDQEYAKVHSKPDITEDDMYIDKAHTLLKDLYSDLGVDRDANHEEIEAAYRLAKMVNTIESNDSEEVKREKESDLSAATLAYRVLTEKREEYNRLWDMINPLKPSIEELAYFDTLVSVNDFYRNDGTFKDFYSEICFPNTESTENIIDAIKANFNSITIESNELEQEKTNKKAYLKHLAFLYKVFVQYRDLYDQEYAKFKEEERKMQETSEYERLEKETAEAFKRADEARRAKEKAIAQEKVDKLKAEANEAKEARKAAKDAKADAKEEKKEANKRRREAAKESRKQWRASIVADWKAKKANKKVKKIEKDQSSRKVLIRKPMAGKIKNALAIVTASAVVVGSGIWAIKNHIDNTNLDSKNNRPSTSQVNTNTPQASANQAQIDQTAQQVTSEAVTKSADAIYNNWKDIDPNYTKEDIVELVKCAQGEESSIDIDTLNATLENIMNASVVPAVTNAEAGKIVVEVKPIEVSSLLRESDPAMSAIKNMESYLNNVMTDFDNLETYATKALNDEILAGVLGEDVDGFNATTSTPEARIIWSRLALGLNGIVAPLGKDYPVEINGTTYTMDDINNGLVFENIITMAINQSKTLIK